MKLMYDNMVTATGRNGSMKQAGIEIYRFDDRISISPITSKGAVGNCAIEIPNASLFSVANLIEPDLDANRINQETAAERDRLREALKNSHAFFTTIYDRLVNSGEDNNVIEETSEALAAMTTALNGSTPPAQTNVNAEVQLADTDRALRQTTDIANEALQINGELLEALKYFQYALSEPIGDHFEPDQIFELRVTAQGLRDMTKAIARAEGKEGSNG